MRAPAPLEYASGSNRVIASFEKNVAVQESSQLLVSAKIVVVAVVPGEIIVIGNLAGISSVYEDVPLAEGISLCMETAVRN